MLTCSLSLPIHPMALSACIAITARIQYNITSSVGEESVMVMFNMQPRMDRQFPDIVLAMMYALQAETSIESVERIYKPQAKTGKIDFSPQLIAHNELLTSDMIRYAADMAQKGELPKKVLGTHNQRGANGRSTEGFLLGWAADEALAAAVYIFLRHPDDMKAGLIEAVNTPGDSDSIATLRPLLAHELVSLLLSMSLNGIY